MTTYSEYLRRFFGDRKVQKISVNAGFSCPNRDGTLGTGGCSYCRNDSFTPPYCMHRLPVAAQIRAGRGFFGRKYPDMQFLAYFQSYTNTYTSRPGNPDPDVSLLEKLYREALGQPDVVGLAVGTRPDTLPDSVVSLLADINRTHPVFVEIGAETSNDDTLRVINRNHTWAQVVDAVTRAASAGLHVGLHLIAGLPGETDADVLRTVTLACSLPIETLKLHQLQILKDTPLHRQWQNGEVGVKPYRLEEYLALCRRIKETVPEGIVIERFLSQAPPDLVVAPKWGLKNYQFMNMLNSKTQG